MQLRKIFAYPVAAGCIVTGIFSLFLTYFNDMRLQAFEVRMLLIEGFLMALISVRIRGLTILPGDIIIEFISEERRGQGIWAAM